MKSFIFVVHESDIRQKITLGFTKFEYSKQKNIIDGLKNNLQLSFMKNSISESELFELIQIIDDLLTSLGYERKSTVPGEYRRKSESGLREGLESYPSIDPKTEQVLRVSDNSFDDMVATIRTPPTKNRSY